LLTYEAFGADLCRIIDLLAVSARAERKQLHSGEVQTPREILLDLCPSGGKHRRLHGRGR
jgi:hypothetical protein